MGLVEACDLGFRQVEEIDTQKMTESETLLEATEPLVSVVPGAQLVPRFP